MPHSISSLPAAPLSPAEQLDALAQRVEALTRQNEELSKRLWVSEDALRQFMERTAQLEEMFELRLMRQLHKVFGSVSHSMEHAIHDMQRDLQARRDGFTVERVDGIHVKETPLSIHVHRQEDGAIELRGATGEVMQPGPQVENMCNWLRHNEHIFNGQASVVINVSIYQRPQDQPHVEAEPS